MEPLQIEIDEVGNHVATFDYESGVEEASNRGLNQGTNYNDLLHGMFVESCGNVLIAVPSDDYPNVKRSKF